MKINAIKAVKMFDGGFMTQPFAFGGEEGKEKFDEQILYRSSLQNFLLDTDEGIILIDTGFKKDFPTPEKKLGAPLYMGEKKHDYMEAFAQLGYKPVTFADLTQDEAFWKGCEGCVNVDILHRTGRKYCICTGMLYDPEEYLPAKISDDVLKRIKEIESNK